MCSRSRKYASRFCVSLLCAAHLDVEVAEELEADAVAALVVAHEGGERDAGPALGVGDELGEGGRELGLDVGGEDAEVTWGKGR